MINTEGPMTWPGTPMPTGAAPQDKEQATPMSESSDWEALIAQHRARAESAKLRGPNYSPCISADELLKLLDMLEADALNNDLMLAWQKGFAVGRRAQQVAVPQGWQPIETAPKDNKRPLLIARFNTDGTLQSIDHNASYEQERESYEMPELYWVWMSENGNVEDPTHWMHQPDWYANLTPETQDGQCEGLTAHRTYCRVITEDV